ncbi:serine/threonine-protein kinase [Streptacidiphilus sp. N1-10]|uniref:non-specific serine/threonine protein kinase n=1 Tax=Streptacidiphilus jeojiensis TaxID=3229225 RepID=A0ABV6XUF3_9ACTN
MDWTVPGYRHTRELGSGASGRVVLALHEETGTPVAIKYLGEELRLDPDFLEEFRGEARLLGDLDTPHVVRLWEYVEGAQGAAIVMELVDGIALRALLRQAGATGPEAALVVLKGSLLGLAAAHAMGVVHRDYKPENVLVDADGSSKLVDFGIAVRNGDAGGIAGTPPYMAPEQWAGDPASAAADVYAATATFFECLTGHRPYPGTEFAELVVQHTEAPIPDEEAPEPVRPLIRRGLAKTAGERPDSAAEFVAELEAVAGTAYGEDWEERGQRKLAALAALLPLLFPSAGGLPDGTTALAKTTLGEGPGAGAGAGFGGGLGGRIIRKRVLVAGLAGGIVLGLLGGGYASGVIGGTTTTVADPAPIVVTSVSPSAPPVTVTLPPGTPTPSASASASPSLSASASATSPQGGTPTTPPPTTAPPTTATPTTAKPTTAAPTTAAPTTTKPTTAPPTTAPPTTTPPSSSAPPAVQVLSLTIDVWSLSGTTATLVANVKTSGTGAVTLTGVGYQSSAATLEGAKAVGSQSVTISGKTSYVRITVGTFNFPYNCGYAGVTLSSSPAAANGSPSQFEAETCIG